MWTRRSLLAAAARSAVVAAPGVRWLAGLGRSSGESGFSSRILIDGCGGPGDPQADDDAALTPRAVADARSSGLTAVNVTVGPVGERQSLAAFEGIFRDLARWEGEFAAHSDALRRVAGPDDLEPGNASGRVGLIFGL
ncbi:MAG TPA: hypothetical protein VKJ00_11535 [Thermoanaerobaculia bacterium]|nr:hypothetical protein [Thermoanaerobaculia bacterium]